jgi:hypothetical protein
MICLTTTRVHVSRSYGEAHNQRFVHGIERASERRNEAERWRKEMMGEREKEKKAVITTRFLQFCTHWATYPEDNHPSRRCCQREQNRIYTAFCVCVIYPPSIHSPLCRNSLVVMPTKILKCESLTCVAKGVKSRN